MLIKTQLAGKDNKFLSYNTSFANNFIIRNQVKFALSFS